MVDNESVIDLHVYREISIHRNRTGNQETDHMAAMVYACMSIHTQIHIYIYIYICIKTDGQRSNKVRLLQAKTLLILI